jgi:CRISPR/Cas system-associated exonuclease Cas4 (RecB family)
VLNPAQNSVIELLGRSSDRAPLADELVEELVADLVDGIEAKAGAIDPATPLWVSKHSLTTIHGCEAHFLADDSAFSWTVAAARGIVAHKAIEVLIHYRGEPHPASLVDEAMARLIDDEMAPVGKFLASLEEFDRAELRALAVDRVTAFQESFPPLKAQWSPRTESKSRVELADGRVVLSGKTDLTLGRAENKVIIDLKSGRPMPHHREDLRFYALLETVKLGAAPRKLASYYLDSARTHPEDVGEAVLRAAVHRTVRGVEQIVAITRGGVEPGRRPGPQCRWCPLQPTCDVGTAALVRADDPDAVGSPW